MTTERACDRCLARGWLIARLAGHLEQARGQIEPALGLASDDLIAAVGGRETERVRTEFASLDVGAVRAGLQTAGLEPICGCDRCYPQRLRALASPPAVVHVAGGLERFLALIAGDPVAIVGARRASPYGLEVARSLARGLGRAGLTIVSGMALGVDSAAHVGALDAGADTVAVLAGPADRAYPAAKRALHRRITGAGAVVSELGPGAAIWRWSFPARNRIIAALAATTIVVEAGERSGALLTAALASRLGRPVGAVPGRITSPQAAGPHRLLAGGAYLVRGAQDVLDQLFGAAAPTVEDHRAELDPEQRALLSAIARGDDTAGALARAGLGTDRGLAALAALELAGYVRRGTGGRFSVVP